VEAMEISADQKVFVHCIANHRVSCFIGLFGQLKWDWTTQYAQKPIQKTWQPDAVWSDYLEQMRSEYQLEDQ